MFRRVCPTFRCSSISYLFSFISSPKMKCQLKYKYPNRYCICFLQVLLVNNPFVSYISISTCPLCTLNYCIVCFLNLLLPCLQLNIQNDTMVEKKMRNNSKQREITHIMIRALMSFFF